MLFAVLLLLLCKEEDIMFCTKCGAKIIDGAAFCTSCGAKVDNSVAPEQEPVKLEKGPVKLEQEIVKPEPGFGAVGGVPPYNNNAGNAVPSPRPKKKMPIGAVIGIICGAVAIIAAVVLVLIFVVFKEEKKDLSLNDYIEVSFSGNDGYGEACVIFDTAGFIEDFGDKIKANGSTGRDVNGYQYTVAEQLCDYYLDYDLDKTSGLSNGDTVTLSWEPIPSDIAETINYTVITDDITYTVSGLSAVNTVDIFAGLEIAYYGIEPEGYAEIEDYPVYGNTLQYTIDKTEGLSNGDTIVVTAFYLNADISEEAVIDSLGGLPESMTKTYTVEGLSKYLSKLSELPGEDSDNIMQEGMDFIVDSVKSNWGSEVSGTEVKHLGYYLLTKKSGSGYSFDLGASALYSVYKLRVDFDYDGKRYDTSRYMYYYTCYTDMEVMGDGSVYYYPGSFTLTSNQGVFEIPVSKNTDPWQYGYYGYETLDDLYDDVVGLNQGNYNVENKVNDITDENMPSPFEENDEEDEEEEDEEEEEEEEVPDFSDMAEMSEYYYDYFLLPESATRFLTEEDLEGYDGMFLTYARNEIYARHGKVFRAEELNEYFGLMPWYDPDPDFVDTDISDIEEKNADFIRKYQEEHGLTYTVS